MSATHQEIVNSISDELFNCFDRSKAMRRNYSPTSKVRGSRATKQQAKYIGKITDILMYYVPVADVLLSDALEVHFGTGNYSKRIYVRNLIANTILDCLQRNPFEPKKDELKAVYNAIKDC